MKLASIAVLTALFVAGCNMNVSTPAPAYRPTFNDFEVAIYAAGVNLPPDFIEDMFLKRFDAYAGVYMAQECLDGKTPTSARFRSFLVDNIGDVNQEYAQLLINKMVSYAGGNEQWRLSIRERIELSLNPEKQAEQRRQRLDAIMERECMRPFMFPESGEDALLPYGLIFALERRPALGSLSDFYTLPKNVVYKWFDPQVGGDKPLLVWWCEEYSEKC